ncbi:AMP-binding protein [Actinomadura madurae]|uniref:AMP-binding protein n=1 Tax=Actinomadura madurae TaxID=1993 RepID=UPI0039999266
MTRTLAHLLEHWAQQRPDRHAVAVGDERVTYRALAADVRRLATSLANRGIQRGTVVALLMHNSVDMVRTWLALTHLGAVAAPINTEFRDQILAQVLRISDAMLLVADDDLLPTAVDVAPTPTELASYADIAAPRDSSADSHVLEPVEADGRDTAMLLFTSGTTGRSKACALSHRYITRHAEIFCEQLGISDEDTLFCPFPLFHADATIFTVAPSLTCGATAALEKRFSASRFWDQARAHGATVFDFMGATLTMLYKQAPSPNDRRHTLRLGWGVPLPEWAPDFEQRFGVELIEVYGLTDAGIVLYNRPGEPRRPGSCGRAVPPFEVRLQDGHGFETTPGETGEICIRASEPGMLLTEYLGMPQETLEAFRDLWLHTGDLARQDEDGFFYFVGRSKDIIRRRGENIAAGDVEAVLVQHPAIREVAAIGVPSPLTEEDLKVCVVVQPGHTLSPQDLLRYATAHLPRHMVPRYLEIYPTLPRTPTEKVAKYLLKQRPFSDSTIDLDTERAKS